MIAIKNVCITAFRGITDQLKLDLGATLTLLYAANGTGKSTICEALEWLLTGQVERLRSGSKFDPQVLVAKFRSDNQLPVVEADMSVGGKTIFVRRTLDGVEVGSDRSQATAVSPGSYLEMMARPAAADETHPVRAQSLRQTWLRGTRFLSMEALARLVDTDPDTIALRKQVFADMFGIRHLLDAEDHLKKYSEFISPTYKTVAQEQQDVLRDVNRLTDILGPRGQILPSMTECETARYLLKIDGPALESIADEIATLAGTLSAQVANLDRRQSAWSYVKAHWEAYQAARQTIATATRSLGTLRQKTNRTKTALERNRKLRERLSMQVQRGKEDVQTMTSQCELLVETASALAKGLGGYLRTQRLSGQVSVGLLRKSDPNFSLSGRTLATRANTVAKLSSALPAYLSNRDELAILESDIAARRTKLPTAQERASREKNLVRSQGTLNDAQERLTALAEPVANLRAAAESYLDHDHSAVNCPVCGHDWKSDSALNAAVTRTASLIPQASAALQSAKRAAERVFRQQSAEIAAIGRQAAQLDRLAKRVESKRRPIVQFETQYRSLGGDPAAPGSIEAFLSNASIRLTAAHLFAEFDSEVSRAQKFVAPNRFDDVAISGLGAAVGAAFAEQIRPRAETTSGLERQLEDTTRQVAEGESSLAHIAREIAALEASLTESHPISVRFGEQWQALDPSSRPTTTRLTQIGRLLASDAKRISQANDRIVAGKSAYEFEQQQFALERGRARLQVLRTRTQRYADFLDTASKGMNAFREAYSKRSRDQMIGMSNVVNPLFARMHANKVVDSIKLGEGEEFLSWLAGAGSATLSPTTDFSHGQRQDLALAIFLCRARDLDGSFFLDEPVTHLDDLNRVGLLDVLRSIAIENRRNLRLFITTSSRAVVRHLVEKFQRVRPLATRDQLEPLLRVFDLSGNARAGLSNAEAFPDSKLTTLDVG